MYDETLKDHRVALNLTADFYRDGAIGIRKEDLYSDHVTEAQKDNNLAIDLKYASEVREGEHLNCMSVAQRFHYYLTGQSVALLP